MVSGRPTAPKHLSLISLIHKWSGTEEAASMKELFESLESLAIRGNWNGFERIQITVLKLTEVAKAFYISNPELHSTSIPWETLRSNFCTNLEMLEVSSNTLCYFKQPRNRKMKHLDNFWNGVADLL